MHERTEYQYQDELPEPRRLRRRFAVHIGKCACCGRRHQGRHPFQTSDALGAAGCMLGPWAVALATELNKELGLSPQKTAKALARFGIRVTAGGVVGAIARQDLLDPKLETHYPVLVAAKGVCPPEDCGSAWGYANLKDILANPTHDEHQEMLEWLGLNDASDFDPAVPTKNIDYELALSGASR